MLAKSEKSTRLIGICNSVPKASYVLALAGSPIYCYTSVTMILFLAISTIMIFIVTGITTLFLAISTTSISKHWVDSPALATVLYRDP